MNEKQISDIDVVEVSEAKTIVATCASCHKVMELSDETNRCRHCSGLLLTTESTLSVGTIVDDRYEVLELIGEGSWGTVYRVRQGSLDRPLALKLMHRRLAKDSVKVQRFQQEAKALGELHHSGIAAVYDSGVSESGQPYLVQDFVQGTSLKDLIKENTKLTGPQFKSIFSNVLDAVQAAHKQKLIHRDIKPENIIASSDLRNATLVDFGISKFAEGDDASLTATGELLGTPLYMSPEQCSGNPVDARSDLYSLGCVMYHMMAGRPPFEADNNFNCMMKHVKEEPPPLTAYRAYQGFTSKALSKLPEDRFQSAEEMKAALSKLPDGALVGERRAFFRPTAWTSVLVCCLVLLLGIAILASTRLSSVEPTQEPTQAEQPAESVIRVPPAAVPEATSEETASTDLVDLMVTETPTSGFTELQNASAAIRNSADWLKLHGHAQEAGAVESELKSLLNGTAPQLNNDTELHAIAVGSGRNENRFSTNKVADVEVTYSDKPIVLCIVARNNINVTVNVHSGAKLKKLYALGCKLRLVGASSSPLTVTDEVDMSDVVALEQKDPWDFPKFKNAIEKAEGKKLTTLIANRDSARYLIGKGDKDWENSLLAARLQPLLERASALEKAEARKAAENFKFLALKHYIDDEEHEQSMLAHFNGLGALDKGVKLNVSDVEQVITTPEGKTLVIGDNYNLYELDANNKATLIPRPEFTWGVEFGCFDPSRKELILSQPDGGMSLFNPLTKKWKPLFPASTTSKAGFVYSPEETCFYTFAPSNYTPGHIRTLIKLTGDGHISKKIELDQPLWWMEGHKSYQLKMHDGKIYAISNVLEIPGSPGPSGELYVIDPKNGHVILTTTLPRYTD